MMDEMVVAVFAGLVILYAEVAVGIWLTLDAVEKLKLEIKQSNLLRGQ